MKKINFKQPKYIFPLVILLPLLFLAYIISNFWGDGSNTAKHGVVTDSINMSLPDAAHEDMGDKMSEMNRRMAEDGAYTAVTGIGEDKEEKDSTGSGYSESELNAIDKANADKIREQKEVEEMERSLAESRKHINSYSAAGNGRGHSGGLPNTAGVRVMTLMTMQQRSMPSRDVLQPVRRLLQAPSMMQILPVKVILPVSQSR